MSGTPRHFARLKTRERATITFSNGEAIACEVSDFCQQGFNLQPIDPNSALGITARHAPDETISIEALLNFEWVMRHEG
jgi:hypothetical protein